MDCDLTPAERTLLAALSAERGSTVTTADLALALWGVHPVADIPRSLRMLVHRLRGKLGSPAIECVHGHGYRLRATR